MYRIYFYVQVFLASYVFTTAYKTLDTTHHDSFQPSWDSLDTHNVHSWFDDAKFGIFVHWGVYSVPAFGTSDHISGYAEWFYEEWINKRSQPFVDFMLANYPANFTYSDLANSLKAEAFNATQWADLVEESGARYFVMTTKHHDGFALWPTNTNSHWNAYRVGPKKDIIGELYEAFKLKHGLHFGLYYSLFEWDHPLYKFDKENNFTTRAYVNHVMLPQLKEIVQRYKPEYIWADGDWDTGYEYWRSEDFLAWLYTQSPVRDEVVVNDRWGIGTACKHGDVKTCGIDRFNPHMVEPFKWENAMTIDRHSWGYRKNADISDYYSTHQLVELLVETVSNGGNILMNIGPDADGSIPEVFIQRLTEIGKWLRVNGEAIYSTKPWKVQKDLINPNIRYTQKVGVVYAILMKWPNKLIIELHSPIVTANTKIFLLGYDREIVWQPIPNQPYGLQILLINNYMNHPKDFTWVFKMFYVE